MDIYPANLPLLNYYVLAGLDHFALNVSIDSFRRMKLFLLCFSNDESLSDCLRVASVAQSSQQASFTSEIVSSILTVDT